ncbi:hypothetical protein D3C73_1499300 [compost metagenome]
MECLWDDNRISDAKHVFVTEPVREWACNQEKRVQALIAEWGPYDEASDSDMFDDPFENRGEAAV